MEEIRTYFKEKKNLANLLILAILALVLPLGVNLVKEQQVFRSRASAPPIVFYGDQVGTVANKQVVKLNAQGKATVGLQLTSRLGPPAGATTQGASNNVFPLLGVLKEFDLVPTAYANHGWCDPSCTNSRFCKSCNFSCVGNIRYRDVPNGSHPDESVCQLNEECRGGPIENSGGCSVISAPQPPSQCLYNATSCFRYNGLNCTDLNKANFECADYYNDNSYCDPTNPGPRGDGCISSGPVDQCPSNATSCWRNNGLGCTDKNKADFECADYYNDSSYCDPTNPGPRGDGCISQGGVSQPPTPPQCSGTSCYTQAGCSQLFADQICQSQQPPAQRCDPNNPNPDGSNPYDDGCVGYLLINPPPPGVEPTQCDGYMQVCWDEQDNEGTQWCERGMIQPDTGSCGYDPASTFRCVFEPGSSTEGCKLNPTVTQPPVVPVPGAGACRDNPVTPPEGGYKWTALCSQSCNTNADCPRGANNQEGWCFGFEDGTNRCLRLDSTAPSATTPTGDPAVTNIGFGAQGNGPNSPWPPGSTQSIVIEYRNAPTGLDVYLAGPQPGNQSVESLPRPRSDQLSGTQPSGSSRSFTVPSQAGQYYFLINARNNDLVCAWDQKIYKINSSGGLDDQGRPCPNFGDKAKFWVGTASTGTSPTNTPPPGGQPRSPGPGVSPSPGTSPRVSPSPGTGVGGVKTVSFKVAEKIEDLTNAPAQPYTKEPMTVNFELKDTTPGKKNVYVEFTDSNNPPKTEVNTASIDLIGPDPTLAGVSCKLDIDSGKLVFKLTGKNFGSTKGAIKAGSSNIDKDDIEWQDKLVQGTIKAPSGVAKGVNFDVTLTLPDGRNVEAPCAIGLSQLALGPKLFCPQIDGKDITGVKFALFEATSGGKVKRQTVALDSKHGVVKNLAEKTIQQEVLYSACVDTPQTINTCSEPFKGQEGTTILNMILGYGDIAGKGPGCPGEGEGTINSIDKACLNQQWGPVKTANKNCDCNNDGICNAFEWSYMREFFNKSDDSEPKF